MSSELLFLTLLANWINTFSENEKGWVGGGGGGAPVFSPAGEEKKIPSKKGGGKG